MRVILLVLLSAFSSLMAVSSYQNVSSMARPAGAGLMVPLEQQALAKIYREVAEIEQTLEYMVWPTEKVKLQQRYLTLLQQALNIEPYNAAAWQTLLTLQRSLDVPRAEQQFSLRRALAYNEWNHKRQPNLINICVQDEPWLAADLADSCHRLLSSINWQSDLTRQAHRFRIDVDFLRQRLIDLGVLE